MLHKKIKYQISLILSSQKSQCPVREVSLS